jgi:hypothetical protein
MQKDRKQQIIDAMESAALINNVQKTENFDKIVNAKLMMNIGLRCPCAKYDEERYCISEKCLKEIQETGTCHCNCWRKE